jgi:hypothetical protein
VGADPRCVGQGPAVFIEAAVEDEGGEILGMADEAEDFVEVALGVAVEAAGRGVGQRWERVGLGHGWSEAGGGNFSSSLAGGVGVWMRAWRSKR